jgi:hypothetical protein
MGSAVNRQVTVRPFFVRVMRPAPDSTSRCFMIAGSDMGNGWASSLTDRALCSSSCAKQRPPGRIGEGGKGPVEDDVLILNHAVKLRGRKELPTSAVVSHLEQIFRKP